MKTPLYYPINFEYKVNNKFLEPIRHKYDLLILLTHIVEYILSRNNNSTYDENKQFIILEKCKFSRVFIKAEHKIFSINFPFDIVTENEKIHFSFFNFTIEYGLLSRLRTSFMKLKESNDIDYLDAILGDVDNEILKEEELPLLFHLLTMEDGYIRYDFDEERANGKLHPLYHYDIFYHQQNTFKIGSHIENSFEIFRCFLDNSQERLYLEKK